MKILTQDRKRTLDFNKYDLQIYEPCPRFRGMWGLCHMDEWIPVPIGTYHTGRTVEQVLLDLLWHYEHGHNIYIMPTAEQAAEWGKIEV